MVLREDGSPGPPLATKSPGLEEHTSASVMDLLPLVEHSHRCCLSAWPRAAPAQPGRQKCQWLFWYPLGPECQVQALLPFSGHGVRDGVGVEGSRWHSFTPPGSWTDLAESQALSERSLVTLQIPLRAFVSHPNSSWLSRPQLLFYV